MTYRHTPEPALAKYVQGVEAERDRLREALTWALGYIEYADVIPTHRDVREGQNDRVLYEQAVDALDPKEPR